MISVIRAVAFANGLPCPHSGQWLVSFDHEAHNGQGHAVFSDDIRRARRFATHADAFEFWNKQSSVRPLRPDGKPNKPLTALTIEIERIV